MHHFEAHELADSWELRAGLLDEDPADASISACLRECAADLRNIAVQSLAEGDATLLEALIKLHSVARVDRDEDYAAVANAAAVIAKFTSARPDVQPKGTAKPVGEIRTVTGTPGFPCAPFNTVVWEGGMQPPPGTKLYAEPLQAPAPGAEAPAGMVEAIRNAAKLADKSDKLDRDRLLGRAVAPFVVDLLAGPAPAVVPLTDEQIWELARQNSNSNFANSGARFCNDFARAVERHFGIGVSHVPVQGTGDGNV